mgnify:CR=1 FL=1
MIQWPKKGKVFCEMITLILVTIFIAAIASAGSTVGLHLAKTLFVNLLS